MSASAFRLPRCVLPHRYEVTLAPDLVTHRFRGSVVIEATVEQATDEVVLHAVDLELSEARVESDDLTQEASISLDETDETATLRVATVLRPGPVRLHLDFAGTLDDDLKGLYRSTFEDADGATRTIAVTQMEATDCRRVFPCFDEPDHKAVFAISAEVADDLTVVSNSPELRRTDLGDGRVRVDFADTMKMSTYLVALVVGPLEATDPVDVDGVPLRVLFTPGNEHLAGFALDAGAFSLRFFADYYGIEYPGTKLDMVAVPDFAFGAMENLGCVVYRENLLLVDPAQATQKELQDVVDVVAHELAHMWFGDLVTMKWWTGIWLNEAFATFMEMTCTDAYRPDWERWMFFAHERAEAFEIDATSSTRAVEFPVHSPDEAEAMFDVLTYKKGSAVVRMLEQYLGADAFRDGIRRYLQTHQFGNTETADLWDALEAETGEPVRAVMDSWIHTAGFPLLDASRDGDTLVLTQRRFRFDGAETPDEWQVPVTARTGGERVRLLLDGGSARQPIGAGPVLVNDGGWGFYRTRYEAGLFDGVLASLADASPLERFVVLDDTWALAEAGLVAAADAARVIERLVADGERDARIWQLIDGVIDGFTRAVDPADVGVVERWATRLLRPVLDDIGTAVDPADDDLRRDLRGLLVGRLGAMGDPDALALSRSVIDDPDADAGLTAGAVRAVATHADVDEIVRFAERYRTAATPQARLRWLYGMARTHDAAAFDEVLAVYGSDAVRNQNVAFAMRAALQNRVHGPRAWQALRADWARVVERVPGLAMNRLLEGVGSFPDADLAHDVESFIAEHPIPGAERTMSQHLDRMRRTVAVREREADRLPAALDT